MHAPSFTFDGQPLIACPSCHAPLYKPDSVTLVLQVDNWTQRATTHLFDGRPQPPEDPKIVQGRLDEVRCRNCGINLKDYEERQAS